jgi:hypothetical protein
MLAAISFIKDELEVSTIFYHSSDTGKKLKDVFGAPPKSIYTKLPNQLGYELTMGVPAMLANDKFAKKCVRATKDPGWFRMVV